MKACSCHRKFNLPMQMTDEKFEFHWIECDFCGNKTKKYDREGTALFKWNEFQFKKGKCGQVYEQKHE